MGDVKPGPATPDTYKVVDYTATTNLRIKTKDQELANKVLDTATLNGANQIGGVNFEVGDRSGYEQEARTKAVEDAKKKAEQAADAAGFKLGKIIGYNESANNEPMLYDRSYAAGSAPEANKQTQLEPGTSDVVIYVTISYQIQ